MKWAVYFDAAARSFAIFCRDVAIVSYNQFATRREQERNEIEYLLPVVKETLAPLGLTTQDMGFTVSGSSDYLAGQAFAFVSALDAIGGFGE